MKKKEDIPRVPEASEKPKLLVLEELGFDDLVNNEKAQRAVEAANGRADSQSAEDTLAAKYKAEGLDGKELVKAIYVGLAGLVDKTKAIQNRKNERKRAAEKASK